MSVPKPSKFQDKDASDGFLSSDESSNDETKEQKGSFRNLLPMRTDPNDAIANLDHIDQHLANGFNRLL